MLFKCNRYVDPGTEVQLQIHTEIAVDSLSVIGTVVRVEKFSPNQFDIGISFLNVDSTARNELSKYIRKCIREKKTV